MTAPFYLFGKQGFVAKSAQFAVIYCRASGTKSSEKLVLQTVGANFVRPSKSAQILDRVLCRDSPCGCPYKRSIIDSSRILCRCRGIGASRSPHPTNAHQ